MAVDNIVNEISAIPELLTLLDIENSIITLDAMEFQQEIAKQIIQQKAEIIIAPRSDNSVVSNEYIDMVHVQMSTLDWEWIGLY